MNRMKDLIFLFRIKMLEAYLCELSSWAVTEPFPITLSATEDSHNCYITKNNSIKTFFVTI